MWEHGGSTQTFYLAPEIEKSYVTNQSGNALFESEIFLGLQKTLAPTVQGQLGLTVAATSNASLSGIIWDDADPEFDNYTYSYKIQHTHVAVKGKLLADAGLWLIPWISGSLGIGFKKKWYDYRELEFIDIALEWCRFEGLKIELNESQKRLIKLIKDNESRFESIEFSE